MNNKAAIFIVELLNAATVAHLIHLHGGTLSQHKALDEFYKALPDLVDPVAETYQGKYGLIQWPKSVKMEIPTDPIQFISELSDFVADSRGICKDTEIQNLIDEIAAQIDQTMYLLKFVK